MRGFERDELGRFLELGVREFPADCLEDLSTVLWFENLACLEFTMIEPSFQGDIEEASTAIAMNLSEANLGAPDDPPSIPEALMTRPLSAEQLQLTNQENQHLQSLLSEELRRPVCGDVVSALMDSLQEGDEPLRMAIVSRLDALLPVLLENGFLQETGTLMTELRGMADSHQELGQGFCTALQRALG